MVRFFYALLWVALIYGGIYVGHLTPSFFNQPQKTLDIFCWGDTVEPQLIEEFYNQTGIKVRVHPFGSNEEMVVKLKAVKGNGYDLICASDYAIRALKNEHLLQEIDHSKISNMSNIDPTMLGLSYDPQNTYSLPVEWEPYVFVTKDPQELSLIDLFKDQPGKRIIMTPDPVEAITYASYALFGKVEHLSNEQLRQVSSLLKKQKKSIEAYVDHRAKYLIETDNCDLALIRSGFARLMERDGVNVHYGLPNDWHFINIENLAISSASKKTEDAHRFIDFYLSKYSQKIHSDNTLVFAVHKDLIVDIPIVQKVQEKNDPQFFQHLTKEEDTRDLWVSLKGYDP
jgi:spermidine/putrescine transport system substrate-binding protein